MTNTKPLTQHCKESPQFAEKLREVVLDGPFDGRQYRVGGNDNGTWLHKARNAFIQGRI